MYDFPDTAPRQRVFILRLWETRSELPDAQETWHCSAQDPQTGERRGFASLDGLMDYLAGQTGQPRQGRERRAVLQLLDAVSSAAYSSRRGRAAQAGGATDAATDAAPSHDEPTDAAASNGAPLSERGVE